MGFDILTITDFPPVVKAGNIARINCTFGYVGPAVTKKLHAAIGNYGFAGFDEILSAEKAWSVPASDTYQYWSAYVDIPITSAINPAGSPYDLYAKLDGVIPDITSAILQNVITVQSSGPVIPDPEFRNLTVQSVTSPVDVGDYCTVSCRWEYRGPAISKTLYAAIGNDGWAGFDEILNASGEKYMPECLDWTVQTGSVQIPITAALNPADSPYDVYAKLTGVANDLISPVRTNILVMSGPVIPDPEYRGLTITSYDASVEPGGYCTVRVGFQYRGPAGTKTLYSAIGNKGIFGFDEILNASSVLSVPESSDWRDITAEVSIFIGTGINPEGSPYDIYAKLTGAGNDISSSVLENVITVVGSDPVPDAEFRNLLITDYTNPVAIGGYCTVKVRFQYRGPALSKTLYSAIGNKGIFGFDEILHGSGLISLAKTLDWEDKTASVQIPITGALDPFESPYDLYAKLTGQANDINSPVLENVITAEGVGDPEFQQLEVLSATSPVQIGGTCWVKVKFQYRGPVIPKTLYAAIGNSGLFGFDEILYSSGVIDLPASEDWRTIESELALEVTESIDPADSPYDVYAKLTGPGNDLTSPTKRNIVEVQEGTGIGDITGAITKIEPLEFEVTAPIKIAVSYNAYCDDTVLQVTGWQTRATIQLNGMSESVEQSHTGRDGTVQGQEITLGNMPDKKLSGKVILEGKGSGDWGQLYAKAINVYPPGQGPGEGMPGVGWIAVAALALLAAGSGKKTTGKAKAKRV